MFNWNQTTVINTLKDVNGEDKLILSVKKGEEEKEGIVIKKYGEFLKDNVVGLYKKAAEEEVKGQAKIAISGSYFTDDDIYRIKLYVRLSGSNNSYYANDLVFKGKPFVFEFVGNSEVTAAELAKKFKSILVAYDDPFLKISEENGKIVFTGDNYTLFTEAKVQHLKEDGKSITGGVWEDIDVEVEIVSCVNGFGTYEHITKDLRLPTAEARGFKALNAEELPIQGATYNQYTIVYCANRGVQGLAAIGDTVKSQTTHSFYVLSTIAGKFETALAKLGTVTTVAKKSEPDTTGDDDLV